MKNRTSAGGSGARDGLEHARSVRGCTVVFAVLFPCAGALAQGDTKERSYIGGNDGERLFDNQLMKSIADTLGNTYKTLHVVVSACYSGGFAEEAAARLQGKYSAAVSRDKEHCMNLQVLLDGSTTYKGETGVTVGGRNIFGWDVQYFKKLNGAADSTAKVLFDTAKEKEYDKANQTAAGPKFHQGNNGGDEKVMGAAGTVEAVMWDNFSSDFFYNAYVTLQRRGYSDNTKENARIDSAFQGAEGRNFGGNNNDPNHADPPCWIDRKAIKSNVQPMLDGLKTRLNQNAGNKTAFAYFGGHGNTAMVSADTLPNPMPGALAQGRVMTPGNATTSLALSESFLDQFLDVSVHPQSDFSRVINAGITLTTFNEGHAGDLLVLLEGMQIGTITLLGSTAGGSYQIEIPDMALQQLDGAHAFDSLTAEISFEFIGGTPASWFQLATEWDFEAGASPFYGVGLAAPSVMVVPAPATALVMGLVGLAATRRRRAEA